MKVLLAGGSGILGRPTAAALAAEGHEVSRLGRGAGNDVRADLLDREAVLRAVDGMRFDAVVHAATALSGKAMTRHRDMFPTNALRTTGTVNLLAAARETGAQRFVAESMMFGYGYGDHGETPLREATAVFGPQGANATLEKHVGAMRALEELTLGTDGLQGISLRFGAFYGAGVTDTLFVPMLRKRALPVAPERGRVLSWVSVGDAVRAVTAALNRGRAGQAYNIADDTPLGFATHVRAIAAAYGVPRPLTVPLWALRAVPLAHSIMSASIRLDNAKAEAELGWQPSLHDSVQGVLALARGRVRSRGE